MTLGFVVTLHHFLCKSVERFAQYTGKNLTRSHFEREKSNIFRTLPSCFWRRSAQQEKLWCSITISLCHHFEPSGAQISWTVQSKEWKLGGVHPFKRGKWGRFFLFDLVFVHYSESRWRLVTSLEAQLCGSFAPLFEASGETVHTNERSKRRRFQSKNGPFFPLKKSL